MIALLVAAIAFLAAFILTVNFYSTWQAFARHAASRSSALSWGFLVAGIVSAAAFVVTIYLAQGRKAARDSN